MHQYCTKKVLNPASFKSKDCLCHDIHLVYWTYMYQEKYKKPLYFSVKVFSMKALVADTIFMSPSGDRITILRGHPSHAKV